MARQRFLALVGAAALALALGLWLDLRRDASPEFHERPVFPTLAAELDTVSEVTVRKGSATPSVTLHQADHQWVVAQRADYPADLSKVHKLLIALGDAKVVEEKTANPAEFPLIGVEDPQTSGATGSEIAVTARDGVHTLIVGKPVGSGEFARVAGEQRSVVIQPSITAEAEPRFWIDSRLIDIPVADVQRIEVKLADAPAYVLKRVKPKEEDFTLEGVPAGRKAADARTLAPSPSLGGLLNADDVALAKEVDFAKAAQATLSLSGDKVIKLLGATAGDKHWIEIVSGADPKLAARFADRAFEIPSYRYEAIFRPIEQLLVPKPTPAAKTPAAKAPGSASPGTLPGRAVPKRGASASPSAPSSAPPAGTSATP